MLTITEPAARHLAQMLVHQPQGMAMRLSPEERGMVMRLDGQRSSDATVAHDGRMVLVFDAELGSLLEDKILRLEDRASGPKLLLSPKADRAS